MILFLSYILVTKLSPVILIIRTATEHLADKDRTKIYSCTLIITCLDDTGDTTLSYLKNLNYTPWEFVRFDENTQFWLSNSLNFPYFLLRQLNSCEWRNRRSSAHFTPCGNEAYYHYPSKNRNAPWMPALWAQARAGKLSIKEVHSK